MNQPQGLWIYCIIENHGKMTWDCRGIHGTSPVFTVGDGEFVAVVSEEPLKKYPLVRDWLIAHQKVNEAVMASHRLLPVRFCTIAENKERILEEVLQPLAPEFRERFRELDGKEEYGLRVRWKDLDLLFKEIGEHNERILEEKKAILNLPPEQRRHKLIDIGHLVKEEVNKKNSEMARAFMNGLSLLACRVKQNNTLGDAMVLNAAFLIEKSKQTEFDQAIEALDSQYGSLLHLKYLGPIPPFNFVQIVIHWKDLSQTTKEETHGVPLG